MAAATEFRDKVTANKASGPCHQNEIALVH